MWGFGGRIQPLGYSALAVAAPRLQSGRKEGDIPSTLGSCTGLARAQPPGAPCWRRAGQ